MLEKRKKLESLRKNGKEEPKTQEKISKLKGEKNENQAKISRSERHLCFSHY